MDTQEGYTGETDDDHHTVGFVIGRASAWRAAQRILLLDEAAAGADVPCVACVLRGSFVGFAQALAQDLQKDDPPGDVLRDHLIDLIDHALETPAPKEAVKH